MGINITYNNFDAIDDFLGIERGQCPPVTDLDVELLSNGRAMSGIVQQYWDDLRDDERKERVSHITGRRKSSAERKKISESLRGKKQYHKRVGGRLIRDGEVVEFDCIKEFCIEHSLSQNHICHVLKGKRKSHKGWKLWAH